MNCLCLKIKNDKRDTLHQGGVGGGKNLKKKIARNLLKP